MIERILQHQVSQQGGARFHPENRGFQWEAFPFAAILCPFEFGVADQKQRRLLKLNQRAIGGPLLTASVG
eukprot:scaffold3808_cov222-Pinguiococcus_pyrenoidosus.AAC.11